MVFYVRKSHVRNRIDREQCVLQDEVVITFHKNRQNRMIGRDSNVRVEKDSYIIHQLINRYKGNGKTEDTIKEFFNLAGTVYLTVRAENKEQITFTKDWYETSWLLQLVKWKYERQGVEIWIDYSVKYIKS